MPLEARPPRIDALTSVRIVLALMVVAGHFKGHFRDEIGLVPSFFGVLATTAVTWFFVLSGFILAYNFPRLATGRDRVAFIVSRFARIWPAHMTCLLLTLALLPGTWYAFLWRWWPYDPLFVGTLLHSWLPSPALNTYYNGPSWSISTEWFFYLTFPLLVARHWWVKALGFGFPVLLSLALRARYGCGAPGEPAACFSLLHIFPPSRLPEFAAGVGLAALLRHIHWRLTVAQVTTIQVAGVMVPLLALWGGGALLYTGKDALAVYVMAFGCLLLSFSFDGQVSRLLSARWLVFAGEISFAIYLVHMPLLQWLGQHPDLVRDVPIFVVATAFLTCIMGLAVLIHLTVERPVREAVRRALMPRPAGAGSAQEARRTNSDQRTLIDVARV